MAKPILVGYDPNEKDHSPVDFGVAAARFTGAPLIIASVEATGTLQSIGQVDDDLLTDCRRLRTTSKRSSGPRACPSRSTARCCRARAPLGRCSKLPRRRTPG